MAKINQGVPVAIDYSNSQRHTGKQHEQLNQTYRSKLLLGRFQLDLIAPIAIRNYLLVL